MKGAVQERVFEEAERRRLEAALGARLETLFGRCPELCGFMVGERSASAAQAEAGAPAEMELFIADIDVYPVLGAGQLDTVAAQISAALADLLNDSPEAGELLAGRTFARTLH